MLASVLRDAPSDTWLRTRARGGGGSGGGSSGAGALGGGIRQERFELPVHIIHPRHVLGERRLAVLLLQRMPLATQAEAVPLL